MFTVTNTRKSKLKERTLNSRNERGCFIQFSSVVLSARFESVALLLLFEFLRVTVLFSYYLYLLRASFSHSNQLNCSLHITHIDSLKRRVPSIGESFSVVSYRDCVLFEIIQCLFWSRCAFQASALQKKKKKKKKKKLLY